MSDSIRFSRDKNLLKATQTAFGLVEIYVEDGYEFKTIDLSRDEARRLGEWLLQAAAAE